MKKRIIICSVVLLIVLFGFLGIQKYNEAYERYILYNAKYVDDSVLNVRTRIINKLIKDNNLKSYLEIGLNNPYQNFVYVRAFEKFSVDPYDNTDDGNTKENVKKWLKLCTHRMTSDEFFKQNERKFDLIFIDGLHIESQVDKDIKNSLKALNKGGFIVVHDCIPRKEITQREKRETQAWNGTVWKSFVKISQLKTSKIKTYVVNADEGVGIIQKMDDFDYADFKPLNLSYENFAKNINKYYTIVQLEKFLENAK